MHTSTFRYSLVSRALLQKKIIVYKYYSNIFITFGRATLFFSSTITSAMYAGSYIGTTLYDSRYPIHYICLLRHNWLTGYVLSVPRLGRYTVYPKKYAHGFVVLYFVVVMQSFIMNSHQVFIHSHQGCFAGTGAIVRLPQCQWSKPDGYGKISQCIITTKHSKAKTMCISWDILYMLMWLLLLNILLYNMSHQKRH